MIILETWDRNFWLILMFCSISISNVGTFTFEEQWAATEFNEFKPRLRILQKQVSIERRLKSWKIEYNFKWSQPYLSRSLNLNRDSNSLNSASYLSIKVIFAGYKHYGISTRNQMICKRWRLMLDLEIDMTHKFWLKGAVFYFIGCIGIFYRSHLI